MSRHYKTIKNGKGTILVIRDETEDRAANSYISIGPNGTDIMIRGAGTVLAFDRWEDLISAIDASKAVYVEK